MAHAAGDSHEYPVYGYHFRVSFPILDEDGDLVSGGGSDTPDSEVSKDSGTFADCTNELTEIATTSGMYFLDLTGVEMAAKVVAVIIKVAAATSQTTPIVLYPRRLPVLETGTAQAGANGTITLASGASAEDDFYNGLFIGITNNTPTGVDNQMRRIIDYNGSTKVATIDSDWGTNPSSSSTYELLIPEGYSTTSWGGIKVGLATNRGLTALPNAAADAAGGVPISDAGGLDLDAMAADVVNINGDAMRGTDSAFLAASAPTNFSSLAITAGGSADSLVQGYVNTLLSESIPGLIATNVNTFFDNNANTTLRLVDDVGTGGSPDLMVNTTIDTLTSQTQFRLVGASSDDDVYNGAKIIITDIATSNQKAVGLISDYGGGLLEVFLAEDPGIFTIVAGDIVEIVAVAKQLPDAIHGANGGLVTGDASNRIAGIAGTKNTLDDLNDILATAIVTAGAINTTSGSVDTVTTNTDMRGTDSALLAASAPTNFGSLVITAGGAVDSLVQGYLNTLILESTAGRIAANFDNFYDNGDSLTTRIVDNVHPATEVVSGGAINTTSGAVDTVTTNTDMRGTDSAFLAASAPTNFGATVITAGGAVDSLVQGYLNTLIVETTAGRIAVNFDNFYDNADGVTTSIVDQINQIASDLPVKITKNVALNNFPFLMVDDTDHITGKTGLTFAAANSQRSIDGAAFANTTNVPTEVANGAYKVNLSAGDLNGDTIILKFTGTAADDRFVTIIPQAT